MATIPTPARDDRKTAAVVAANARPDKRAQRVEDFATFRTILRDPALLQAGGGSDFFDISDPVKAPVFFLDGPPHKTKRATIARYFTPKAITGRYHAIIDRITEEQIGALRRDGTGRLDTMSFDLAVAVAADIVGLTVTDRKKMARRLATSLASALYHRYDVVSIVATRVRKLFNQIDFYFNDVKPTIRERRARPQDDIVSRLIEVGLPDKAIMIECMTYAAAGMVTTREFIVMSAWHMFDDPALRERFLNGGEDDQFAILLEILRLEPIAAFLYRKEPAEGGAMYALCTHQANTDAAAVGECPYTIDPDRARKVREKGEFMSFGDGAHHCPGWQVALHESRAFLDALFRLPGIRLVRAPDIGWSEMLQSYELRNAIVACDPAPAMPAA